MSETQKACALCFWLRRRAELPQYYCTKSEKIIIDADNKTACKDYENKRRKI